MGCASSTSGIETKKKFHESYRLGRKLGEGAFGQVRVARARISNEDYAVKIVDVCCRDISGEPTREADRERVSNTKSEIKVWEAIGNDDYIVALQASFFEKNLFYMVMEKCDCSLMDKLSKASTMMEKDLCRIFTEMLLGIKHVHDRDIVHRDIKPDNFLFGGPSGSVVKLCDFGLAAKLPKSKKLKGVYGTAPYMSPEMLAGSGYDTRTDVWSFGATAYLMIHGDFPYSPKEATAPAMKKMIVAGKPEIKFVRTAEDEVFFSRPFVDRATPFLQALLQRAPNMRKLAEQVLELPFLAPAADKSLENLIVTGQGEETVLAPAMRKARKATKDVKALVKQPTKQRNLDELLVRLQAKLGADAELTADTMYFSEGKDEVKAAAEKTEKSDDRIHRRSETRHSTHSGVVSPGMLNKKLEPLGAPDAGKLMGDIRRRADSMPPTVHEEDEQSPAEVPSPTKPQILPLGGAATMKSIPGRGDRLTPVPESPH